MKPFLLSIALLLSGCTAPEPVEVPSDDKEAWLHYLKSLGIPDIGEEAK